jgi:CheY-like chemotaxis protein
MNTCNKLRPAKEGKSLRQVGGSLIVRERPAGDSPTHAVRDTWMNRARLVLVDQNDLLLEMLSACLGRIEGLEIAGTARSGRTAVALVDRVAPDVVLLNLTLPDMSGLTALRRMKSLPRAAICDLGADDCIVKSELAQAIWPTVERLLRGRSAGGSMNSDAGAATPSRASRPARRATPSTRRGAPAQPRPRGRAFVAAGAGVPAAAPPTWPVFPRSTAST